MMTAEDIAELRAAHPRHRETQEASRGATLECHSAINDLLDEVERLQRPEFCDCARPSWEEVAVVGRSTDLRCRECARFMGPSA